MKNKGDSSSAAIVAIIAIIVILLLVVAYVGKFFPFERDINIKVEDGQPNTNTIIKERETVVPVPTENPDQDSGNAPSDGGN